MGFVYKNNCGITYCKRESYCKYILWLCFFAMQVIVCNAQCVSDDSLRREINFIKNEQRETSYKINELAGVRTAYLNCHQKYGPVYAEILHRMGDFYAKAGSIEQGIAYTAAAVDINKHTGKPESFLCNSYYNLGIFYAQLGLVHHSDDCFNHCIAIGRGFPEKYFIVGMAHAQLAYSFFKAGDYQQARGIAIKGIFFSDKAKDTVEQGALWAQKAQAEIELGDFKGTMQSITIALTRLSGRDNIDLATAYSIYADFLDATGKYHASTEYYQKAFLLNKKLQNIVQCANNLNDLGKVYDNDLKQPDSARKWYNKGLVFAKQNSNSYQMAGLYQNLGVTYWRQHDFKQALIFYQKALNILPIKFTNRVIINNPGAELLNQISNDYYVSTLLANKAESLLALYKQTGIKPLLEAALRTFLLSDRSIDMMRWKQSGEVSKLLWRSQTKEMYENAIEVCYLLNDTENGFYFFEKSRSVLLDDQLNYVTKTSFNDEKLKRKMQASMDSVNQQMLLLNNCKTDNRLNTKWLSVHQQWEGQQTLLKAKLYGGTDLPDKATGLLGTAQDQLRRNKQSLIEYFNNDSVVYAVVVTPLKAKIYKILYPDYIYDSDEFLKYCSNAGLLNQHYDHYVNLAVKLYQKLFKPLQLYSKQVVISPGERFIPFDALLDDPHSAESFLLKKYAFSYVYSMRVSISHRTGEGSQKLSFLGIAPEHFKENAALQPLQGSVASLRRIQTGFNSTLLLNGNDAKKSELLSQLPNAQIVQIYSHAAADSNNRDPLLYMADSAVMMSEIQKLNCRNTDLVLLSACNTGVGYMAVGEGMFSMARGFRLAGIPSTVTNLWQADNEATYALTESFYKYIKMGFSKDEALRSAKLDLIKRDQSHVLPYYWAATIIIGDNSALNISLTKDKHFVAWLLPIFTVFLALLSGICFFVWRKRGIT
jgi:CHAT domain-containing protein/Tfp pilus assembly protein PilF